MRPVINHFLVEAFYWLANQQHATVRLNEQSKLKHSYNKGDKTNVN